jgi:hypothetical protein
MVSDRTSPSATLLQPGLLRVRVAAVVGLGPVSHPRRGRLAPSTPADDTYRYSVLLEAETRRGNGGPVVGHLDIIAPPPDRRDFSHLIAALGGLLPGESMPDCLESLLGREHLVQLVHTPVGAAGKLVPRIHPVGPLGMSIPPAAYDKRVVPFVWTIERGWPPRFRSWWFLMYGEEVLRLTSRVLDGPEARSRRMEPVPADADGLSDQGLLALVFAQQKLDGSTTPASWRHPASARTSQDAPLEPGTCDLSA